MYNKNNTTTTTTNDNQDDVYSAVKAIAKVHSGHLNECEPASAGR